MSDQPEIPESMEDEVITAEVLPIHPGESLPVVPVVITPAKPPVWPIFVVLLLSIGVQILGLGLTGVLVILRHPEALRSPAELHFVLREALESPENILLTAAATMAGFALLAAGATWLGGERLRDRLRLTRPSATPGLMLVALMGVLGLQLAFMAAAQLKYLPQSDALEEMFIKINALDPLGKLAALLVIGVAPGICEEALFRGYVQTGLTRRWGPWRGALITGFLFGLMHLNLLQGLFAMVLGVYLGLLTERTGSVLPAMLLHGTNNVIATLLAIGNWDPVIPRPELVLGLAFFVVVLTEYVVAAPIVAKLAAGRVGASAAAPQPTGDPPGRPTDNR